MERGPRENGPRFHFGPPQLSLPCFLQESLNQILWRRIEKDERNLLKEVDEKKHGGDE